MQNSGFDFEIYLQFSDGSIFDDVTFSTFFRNPIVKSTGFNITRVSLPQTKANELHNTLALGDTPKCQLIINNVDQNTRGDFDDPKRIKHIKILLDKTLQIVHVKPVDNTLNDTEPTNVFDLIMVDPVMYLMNKINSFNRIIENKTGFEIIEEYEGYLISTYGNCFEFIKRLSKQNVSNYIYEQILIKEKCDLDVPINLLYNYKILNNFGYYYFDDFGIGAEFKKDIVGYLVDLGDLNNLKRRNVETYKEANYDIKCINNYSINDYYKKLLKNEDNLVVNNKEISAEITKGLEGKITKKSIIRKDKVKIYKDREVELSKSNVFEANTSFPVDYLSIYAPDNVDLALERYNRASAFFNLMVEGLELFEVNRSFPDFPQFGELYNFDKKNYTWTPISIVNIFKRKTTTVPFLEHLCRFLCVKYHSTKM